MIGEEENGPKNVGLIRTHCYRAVSFFFDIEQRLVGIVLKEKFLQPDSSSAVVHSSVHSPRGGGCSEETGAVRRSSESLGVWWKSHCCHEGPCVPERRLIIYSTRIDFYINFLCLGSRARAHKTGGSTGRSVNVEFYERRQVYANRSLPDSSSRYDRRKTPTISLPDKLHRSPIGIVLSYSRGD